ncbi:MAG: lipopolysaccharide biosynthesis protein [Pseudoflavonifractor sp.]|nr:lipopolysaccharide biosynthesis protein [Alloprevotella sp.]MCM1117575.1 lipopolysaccharide biosynthesis protein [Pseudoflavonifractor sp.]
METDSDDHLKQKTARGLLWGGIGSGGLQLLNLFFGIFLSRLLSPSDYGIIGSLTFFSAMAGILTESGFIPAIATRREATDRDYNSVFWFNLVMASALYLLLFLCAPAIADFYHQPEMTALSRFLFLSFLIGGVTTAPAAYFFRNLMVKERTRIQLIAIVISGVMGVACALNGMGYWGLAIQTVLYSLLNSVMIWVICPWRPRWSFSWEALKAMLPFSFRQLLTSVFVHVNNNLFALLLGRFYGMKTAGFYNQGSKWTTMGYTTVSGMLSGVALPVFRQATDNRERLARIFLKMVRFTCFVSFPALFGLAITASEIIEITVTAKWLPAVPVMQILCVWGAFMPLSTLYAGLVNSLSRPAIYMWTTIGQGALQLIGLCITYRFGLQTMLIVYVSVNILWLLVWQRSAGRLIGVGLWSVVRAGVPYLFVSLGVMGVAWVAARPFTYPVVTLAVKIIVASGLYILLMWRLNSVVFRESLDYLRGRRYS